ncbi:MAG: NHL repeat-containing protein, partial [bacterium]
GQLATAANLTGAASAAPDAACRICLLETAGQRLRRIAPVIAVARLSVTPSPAEVGQIVTVTLTVTNTGSLALTGVLPSLDVNAGASLVQALSGPVPAGPVGLALNAGQSFVWTFSVVGAGAIRFTATGTGVDSGTGAVVAAAASGALTGFVRCLSELGIIGTVAGDGTAGSSGDSGAASAARVSGPDGVAVDASGNVFIADTGNHKIRRVDGTTGIITTVAGPGAGGSTGEGPATAFRLNAPARVAVDASGNLYIADTGNMRIRKVTASTGAISTLAGTGAAGYNADGIAAATALLNAPGGVAVDASGNVFIADTGNHRIRRVDAVTGNISTAAGTGVPGFGGDGFAAVLAQLDSPAAVAVDETGRLVIADTGNHRVRAVDPASGNISTLAGTGAAGFNGDLQPAGAAELNGPESVQVDRSGNVYIADTANHRIRKVDALTGEIASVAGTGSPGFNGDGLGAGLSELDSPYDVAVDSSCRLLIADRLNERIRGVTPLILAASVTISPATAVVGQAVQVVLTVTNTGADLVTGLVPTLDLNTGGGNLILVSGPVPAGPVALALDAAQSFVWTFSAAGAGGVGLTATG